MTVVAGEGSNAVVVAFPLRGEGWVAVTSPADRVPSHGTDMLGQRFAYDFLMTDERAGLRYHPAGRLRTFLFGVPTRECYAWGAAIFSPFDGQVVRAVDGQAERAWVHPIREAILAVRNAMTFTADRLPSILGNHVIARHGDVVAAFVHLAPGSVAVSEGQHVQVGDMIGRVGHSGNSTSPHLHFQLMDSVDPTTAKGVPCAFSAYDVLRAGVWQEVRNGIPGKTDQIRVVEPDPSQPNRASAVRPDRRERRAR